MSVLTLEAKLERVESSTPWGFRMQGGREFGCPLTIQKVNHGSLAAKCGLMQGDIILKIGNNHSDSLKHKEAQDCIINSGNKLDLLLQRIREKKSGSKNFKGTINAVPQQDSKQIQEPASSTTDVGGTPPKPSYETFSTPTISPYQPSPVQPGGGAGTPTGGPGANYNISARPFGSAPTSNKPNYGSPNMNNITQQTQNISISPAKPADFQSAAEKYAEREEKPSVDTHQSKSFKFLKDIMESGQEPPSALRPTVYPAPGRRSSSPQTVTPGQTGSLNRVYNNPSGLYSDENLNAQKEMFRDDENEKSETVQYDEDGKRIYRPSETFKLIQEQEVEANKPPDEDYKPSHSRTFKLLQQKLDEGAPPPAPAPIPKAAPAAPKPGVWSPGQGGGSATVAKPFTPSVAPPAPAPAAPGAPKGAPPVPSGVGATRGKRGDATVFKSGEKYGGGSKIPVCASCGSAIRGPFVVALGKTWCPDHFTCANPRCGVKLLDIGFVEEGGYLYCEKDYEQHFAPHCGKCGAAIIGECVNALQNTFHPACFTCFKCKQPIGGNQFHIEEGNIFCENDWKSMFQTMCTSCNFPIEPGDRWVEAMKNNYHSECFNCSTCQINLEGQPFFAKAGKPYCKKHAR